VQRCKCGFAACKGANVEDARLVDPLIGWSVGKNQAERGVAARGHVGTVTRGHALARGGMLTRDEQVQCKSGIREY
jgi:hypothetical protein